MYKFALYLHVYLKAEFTTKKNFYFFFVPNFYGQILIRNILFRVS